MFVYGCKSSKYFGNNKTFFNFLSFHIQEFKFIISNKNRKDKEKGRKTCVYSLLIPNL